MGAFELDNEISKICVACGMCCDGTLFDQANIKDQRDKILADSIGLSTLTENGEIIFSQPCPHFIQKCTIHDQTRPKICGSYFCRPIRDYQENIITLQEVKDLIFKTVRLKQQFDIQSRLFPEFSDINIYQVRKCLNTRHLPLDEQINFRRRHSMLLLTGAKLFPLLNKISSIKIKSPTK